jgi:hypothetical protein
MRTLLVALLLSALQGVPAGTGDPRPTPEGAPRVSFLEDHCRLEVTAGADWNRLWLNCGAGPHLLSEPSSLTWHARIRSPEQALELVRLFSSTPQACDRLPRARWIEIRRSERTGWLALEKARYDTLCPAPSSAEQTGSGGRIRWFLVTRCLLAQEDGNLYRVEQQVKENGDTATVRETLVLADAGQVFGTCALDLR